MKRLSNQKYHSWKPCSRVTDYNILQPIVFHHPTLWFLTFQPLEKKHQTIITQKTPAATLIATEMNRSNVGSLPTAKVKYPSAAGITCRSGTPWYHGQRKTRHLDELEQKNWGPFTKSTENGKTENDFSRVNWFSQHVPSFFWDISDIEAHLVRNDVGMLISQALGHFACGQEIACLVGQHGSAHIQHANVLNGDRAIGLGF